MGTNKSSLETLSQGRRDITIEDLCWMFGQATCDQSDAEVLQEAFRLMISDPARARSVIGANPDLAILEILLDLVENLLPDRPAAQVH